MKKRFAEEQIMRFLKQAEAGIPVKELCRPPTGQNSTLIDSLGEKRVAADEHRQPLTRLFPSYVDYENENKPCVKSTPTLGIESPSRS